MGKSYYSGGGGKTDFLRRLAWDKPSPTLVTRPAMPATDLAHPVKDRPLSIQKYKRIQEFSENWELAGPLIQQYKQVGNAVPIILRYAIGSLVKGMLSGIDIIQFKYFKYSRYKRTSDIEWISDFEDLLKRHNGIAYQKDLRVWLTKPPYKPTNIFSRYIIRSFTARSNIS